MFTRINKLILAPCTLAVLWLAPVPVLAGPTSCTGDLNDDGTVNASDLAILLGAWGPNPGHAADLTGDGAVNASDLAILLGAWGLCDQCVGDEECDDGEFCNGEEQCAAGRCEAGSPPDCHDADPCTADACDPLKGCVHNPGGLCNDDCETAMVILVGNTAYDTTGATTDGTAHAGCEHDGQTYLDIWYNHTATCTGELTVSTCDQAAYDTDLVVYDGCDCATFTLLACSDDTPGCAGFTSEATVPVTVGECYKIRIGGFSESDSGNGTLTVSCDPGCTTAADCNDGNDCTTDSCDPVTGCAHASNSLACSDGLFCNGSDTCGGGTCSVHSGDPCASGSDCANFCTEATDSCLDPVGSPCGSGADTDCDNPDTCNGSGVCLLNREPAGAACGSAANTDCDNPDTCNGTGTCQTNNEPAGTACTLDANPCTNDVCNAAGLCTHPSLGDGTACTSDANQCTNDVCSVGTCTHPSLPAGTACGSSANTICTDPDTCNGSGVCTPNNAPAGTPCGSPENTNCDNPDSCDASGVCQANHEPNGLQCFDPDFCNGPDNCQSGVCSPTGNPPTCDDSNPCTTDTCDSKAGCIYTPIVPCP